VSSGAAAIRPPLTLSCWDWGTSGTPHPGLKALAGELAARNPATREHMAPLVWLIDRDSTPRRR
jgi:hypothetical protein